MCENQKAIFSMYYNQKVSRINISKPDELPERQKALRQISVSECEFSKALDKVYLIRTGTTLGDIHVAGRLSRTSCSLHPDDSPLLKKISTLSDRHLPEGLLPLREFVRFTNNYFSNSPFKAFPVLTSTLR